MLHIDLSNQMLYLNLFTLQYKENMPTLLVILRKRIVTYETQIFTVRAYYTYFIVQNKMRIIRTVAICHLP